MSKQDSLENLSAVMDGETPAKSGDTIRDMSRDEDLTAAWANYHLIRDSLTNQLPDTIDTHLADRVRAAIASEPAILAPQKPKTNEFLKPVAGFAIAASVTAAVLLGVQNFQNDESGVGEVPVVAEQTISSNLVQPVVLNNENNVPAVSPEEQQQLINAEAINRMNRYLINHNELRANSAVKGMPPYVRMIGYEAQQAK